jgi:hypothetical protein
MKQLRLLAMLAIASLAMTVGAAPSVYPVGVTLYQPDLTWNGYTVLSLLGAPGVAVIDMNGRVVKQWSGYSSAAGGPMRVLPNGEVIGAVGVRQGRQESLRLVQQDFSGREIWALDGQNEIQLADGSRDRALRQHHDWQRADFPAGYYSPATRPASTGAATLVLAHADRMVPAISDRLLQDDHLIEYGPDGRIRWQWLAGDHINEFGFSAAALAAIKGGAGAGTGPAARGAAGGGAGAGVGPAARGAAGGGVGPGARGAGGAGAGPAARGATGQAPAGPAPARAFDWLHINSATYVGPNQWHEAGDQRFAPDNVIVSSRQASFIAIIARDGKVVWRLGPDFRETPQMQRIGQFVGPHHPHVIPKGLPGAGNVLVFDNGGSSGYGFDTPIATNGYGGVARATSRVLEIDPVKMETVWSYTANGFFSTNISGAQRLPNGNTLITEGAGARVFEVTPQRRIVWEYMSANADASPSNVYRAYRVPYDWIPQLAKPVEKAVVPPAGFRAP